MTNEKPRSQNMLLKIILLFFAFLAILSFIYIPVADLAIVKIFDIFAKLLEVTRGAILVVFGAIIAFYIYNEYQKGKQDEQQAR